MIPFNIIKSKFKVNTFYGSFLYKRLVFIVVAVLGDALFAPLYTKLIGGNLPIATISLIYLIGVSAGLFVPLFKDISWYTLKYFLYLGDICGMLCYALYFLFDNSYLYIALGFHVLSCIINTVILSIYHTRQSNIISKAYAKDYEEYLVSANVFKTISVLSGYILAILLNMLGGSTLVCIAGICLSLISCFLYTRLLYDLIELEKTITEKIFHD